MRKLILMTAALGGLFALSEAKAAPVTTVVQPAGITHAQPAVTKVDYYWNHRHWEHRRWDHHHWHYY